MIEELIKRAKHDLAYAHAEFFTGPTAIDNCLQDMGELIDGIERRDALIRELVAALDDVYEIFTASFPALADNPPMRSAAQALARARAQGFEP